MDHTGSRSEFRRVEGTSIEAEYAIGHPLTGNPGHILAESRAMELYIASVKYLQDGDQRKAIESYQEGLRQDPALHEHACDALRSIAESCEPEIAGATYYWLGIHTQYLEDLEQAAAWYSQAVDSFNQTGNREHKGRAHCNLGRVKLALGDPTWMEEFQKAIQLNPRDGIAYIDWGVAFYLADDEERAMDEFAQAIWIDPNRYSPDVISRLQKISYTVDEDMGKIGLRIAKMQGIDLEALSPGGRGDFSQACSYFESGNRLFQSHRYMEALEQFEKGKNVSREIPGNFLGVSMTCMQMIEVGAIPKDQIRPYLIKADQNIDECLRIAPANSDYMNAKQVIRNYFQRYHVTD